MGRARKEEGTKKGNEEVFTYFSVHVTAAQRRDGELREVPTRRRAREEESEMHSNRSRPNIASWLTRHDEHFRVLRLSRGRLRASYGCRRRIPLPVSRGELT